MAKRKEFKEADCSFCGKHHVFIVPCVTFTCGGCGVGQKVEQPITARQTVGRNETGHYLPPGTST